MTRSELITELAASNPHLLKADVELIVAEVFDRITDALFRGDRVVAGWKPLPLQTVKRMPKVELRGFGTFTVKRRNARIGRNPRTGEPVPVDEKARPFFDDQVAERGVPDVGNLMPGGRRAIAEPACFGLSLARALFILNLRFPAAERRNTSP